MTYKSNDSHDRKDVGTLTGHFRVRVLNCSAAGCLVETDRPVAVGNVGRLRVLFGGREFDDTIQIVRCERIVCDSPVYHVATKFLSTAPPYMGSLRYGIYRETGDFAGWLDTNGDQ